MACIIISAVYRNWGGGGGGGGANLECGKKRATVDPWLSGHRMFITFGVH